VLEARGVTRTFGPVTALSDVSWSLRPGEVHGLVGENGAGKSTLLKILSGIYQPSGGSLALDGSEVTLTSPSTAMSLGIGVVHQELNLIRDLTVAENIALGQEPTKGVAVDRAAQRERAQKALARIGSDIDPDRRVSDLSLAQQQMVEIARALSQSARYVILDEPTAVLSAPEVARLMEVVEGLRAEGVGVAYVSHHLHEVERLADRVTVLRDGKWVAEMPRDTATPEAMANAMVGRALADMYPAKPVFDEAAEPVLQAKELLAVGARCAELQVRPGEVLGVAGLVGSGRTELLEALAGFRAAAGEVQVGSRRVAGNPVARIQAGVALVHEDRKGTGLHLERPIDENVVMASWPRYATPIVQGVKVRATAEEWRQRLAIRLGSVADTVSTLSGGNQQKVSLAKWLETKPKALLLDEPTRGVDIGARAEIYRLIAELAGTGLAVIVVSSELPELLGLCHRIAVMRKGEVVGELNESEMSEEAIMRLAAGVAA
jgi:ABC-type sugar transport system ATPase subunit